MIKIPRVLMYELEDLALSYKTTNDHNAMLVEMLLGLAITIEELKRNENVTNSLYIGAPRGRGESRLVVTLNISYPLHYCLSVTSMWNIKQTGFTFSSESKDFFVYGGEDRKEVTRKVAEVLFNAAAERENGYLLMRTIV